MSADKVVRISDMLSGLTLVCGNCHKERQIMYLKETEDGEPFHVCPKYSPENREEYEQPCMNRISTTELEHMVEALSDKIQEEEDEGNVFFPKNYKFETKVAEYKVIEFSDEKRVIQAMNKRAKVKHGSV